MAVLAIRAGRLLTPLAEIGDGVVLVEDGRVTTVAPREAIVLQADAREYDARPWTAVPGFVDIHIHGAGGHDVMEADRASLDQIAATVVRTGTTTIIATTVSAPEEDTLASLQWMAQAVREQPGGDSAQPAAELAGIHLEGPFISRARRGVHPQDSIVAPSTALLKRFLEAADGTARILTLAPELPGALELIDSARQAGLVAAIGHTDATYEQTCAAIDRGASHAVHVFNAMRPFSHRDTGVLGAVLTRREITAEVIADGIHVDPPALELLLKAKGTAQVILVSDGTAATSMPSGVYRLGMFDMTVSGGVCRDAQGHLAGSTLTLDRAITRVAGLGVPLRDAVRMATLNPAQRVGLEGRKGSIAAGADADLVFLDEALRVAAVMTSRMSEPARMP